MDENLPAVRTERETTLAKPGQTPAVMAVAEVERQMNAVHGLMRHVMKKGVDFDIIKGTEKPSLLQPGAEKLGMMFRIAPTYEVTKTELPNGHREYQSHCRLTNITTGQFLGEAYGLCSTMETRYRWRQLKRTCPHCGQATIIKGQAKYSRGEQGFEDGGWLCWKKKDGCGAKFPDGDPLIVGQEVGREENKDIADNYHTSLAISQKRSYVRAIRNATAASAIFTDSTDDLEQGAPPQQEPDRRPDPAPADDASWDGAAPRDEDAPAPRQETKTFEQRRSDVCQRFRDLGYKQLDMQELGDKEQRSADPARWNSADIDAWAKIATRLEKADDGARSGR